MGLSHKNFTLCTSHKRQTCQQVAPFVNVLVRIFVTRNFNPN